MLRALFEKKGNAIWISHLDLMRLFQRAFKRADLHLTHTQGFNPRPSVSIALPLSVGVESACELLDFTLDGDAVSCEEICTRLNACLVEGVRVLAVYETGRKLKELSYLDCRISLEYDQGIPAGAEVQLQKLFAADSLIVQKKGKNGIQDQDIIPMIKHLKAEIAGEREIVISARVCCQNPSLNPMQLVAAMELYLPELKPDFAKCARLEIYDANNEVFR